MEGTVDLAAKGRWEKGEFVLRVYDLAKTDWSEPRFRFKGDRVEIASNWPVFGYREVLRGRAPVHGGRDDRALRLRYTVLHEDRGL